MIYSKDLSAEQKTEILMAKVSDGILGVCIALAKNHVNLVEIFIEAILSNQQLSSNEKKYS